MFSRLLSTPRLLKIVSPLVASLLLLPGCGHNHCNQCNSCTSCASDSSTYRAYENYTPPPSNISSPPPTVAPSDGYALRGPRPQSEIDSIYSSAKIQPLPPLSSRPPANAPGNIVIATPGQASWNVPVSRQWRHIVVHHSASPTGSASSFDRAHREKGWDGLGYHFVIGNGSGSGDGQVEVGYRWTQQMQGAHAGNYEYNQHGVGICLVGDFEKGGPPSAAQMYALRTLVAFLQARCSIPTNEIIGHGNVPGRNTECPGRHLDMAAFRSSMSSVYVQPAAAAAADKPMLVKAVAKP